VANTYLEDTYSEVYPAIGCDEDGLRRLFRQFSFRRHPQPRRAGDPRLDPRGRRTGLLPRHAYGAAFDNPGLVVACVVGDGEAETGPLAASWHSDKFLDPARDGAVLPNPAAERLQDRQTDDSGPHTRRPNWRRCSPATATGRSRWRSATPTATAAHQAMAAALDDALDDIGCIQAQARGPVDQHGRTDAASVARPHAPACPMIILRSPKGWTGPKSVDGKRTEATGAHTRSRSRPARDNPAHLAQLEQWLASYRPSELFDASAPAPELPHSPRSASGAWRQPARQRRHPAA